MSGLTEEQLELNNQEVKNRLDQPAIKFLEEQTITSLRHVSFVFIDSQLVIIEGNKELVKIAIYDICAWRAFGAYGESISQTIQMQNTFTFQSKLKFYETVAKSSCALLGIELNKEIIDDNLEIPVAGMGGSDIIDYSS